MMITLVLRKKTATFTAPHCWMLQNDFLNIFSGKYSFFQKTHVFLSPGREQESIFSAR
jgi:hypothetical protein